MGRNKYQVYQLRMKRRPTRAEKRFDSLLQRALKGSILPDLKQTQVKTYKDRKKRKFVKQKIFEDIQHNKAYIVDFYIPKLKLVFEVDGDSHKGKWNETYDAVRSSFLATRGIKVVRFTNEETLNFDTCISKIKKEIKTRFKIIMKRNQFTERFTEPFSAHEDNIDISALTKQYVDAGGKITICPVIGRKRKFSQVNRTV